MKVLFLATLVLYVALVAAGKGKGGKHKHHHQHRHSKRGDHEHHHHKNEEKETRLYNHIRKDYEFDLGTDGMLMSAKYTNTTVIEEYYKKNHMKTFSKYSKRHGKGKHGKGKGKGRMVETTTKVVKTEEVVTGEKDHDQMMESFYWKIKCGEDGFHLDNTYNYSDSENGEFATLVFTSNVTQVVEFNKTNPDSDSETYIEGEQNVVARYNLSDWKAVRYTGQCRANSACNATFETTDECMKITVYTNLDGEGGERVELSPDDIKIDYDFGEGCPVSSDDNALALIGYVDTSRKSKDITNSRKKTDQVGVEDEEIDGVASYLTWLDTVDCDYEGLYQGKRKVNTHIDRDGTKSKLTWTVHKRTTDKVCKWDPVQGIRSPSNMPFEYFFIENGGMTGGAIAAIVILCLMLVSLAVCMGYNYKKNGKVCPDKLSSNFEKSKGRMQLV